ncbi:hypothetical protein BZA05DRAFT_209484 [Tricharina praecox]|uniref:uncharacterized protein n=1 Tax=Tricharina praecox TaxID=43433 RepID=UPI002220E102|nr:uncharacterized protein BZA05DRAFT_209484 [Tricharina praecox]KAI5842009.1 hypothetical protein BZA05DRAFT_209484 [Tricharina praecox]
MLFTLWFFSSLHLLNVLQLGDWGLVFFFFSFGIDSFFSFVFFYFFPSVFFLRISARALGSIASFALGGVWSGRVWGFITWFGFILFLFHRDGRARGMEEGWWLIVISYGWRVESLLIHVQYSRMDGTVLAGCTGLDGNEGCIVYLGFSCARKGKGGNLVYNLCMLCIPRATYYMYYTMVRARKSLLSLKGFFFSFPAGRGRGQGMTG